MADRHSDSDASVYFGGIDDKSITQEMLWRDFEHCGEITKVIIPIIY